MNHKMIGRLISAILLAETIFMIPALIISIYEHTPAVTHAFAVVIVGTLILVGAAFLVCRNAKKKFYAREGLVCVALSWVFMSIIGCLPFVLSKEIPGFVDALFEIVSGFTTTGATILSDVEAMPRALLYWRSFSHWLGGMGVLVFVLAIIPNNGNGGHALHLLRAESTGPSVGKLVPHIKKTALILYIMYVVLTALDFIFLILGGMPLFDSICTAFGTAGTGGFGIRNDSIASYSPYIQWVCSIFMLLFGVNFSCYYLLLIRSFSSVFFDEELRLYGGVILGSTALIFINIRPLYATFGETLRHSFFQVSSIITTTGFATTDFDLWPAFSKAILLFLMIIGACAGSTGGGIKCIRVLLLIKSLRRNIRRLMKPNTIETIKVNKQTVSETVVENTNSYLAAYAIITVVSFIIVSLDGFSVTTNISAVLACFNNIGPGLDAVGPTCNFAGYGILSKLVLIGDMLAGRLEIFPVLALLSKSTWFKK